VAAAQIPMMRELKVRVVKTMILGRCAAAQIPMMRELKVGVAMAAAEFAILLQPKSL